MALSLYPQLLLFRWRKQDAKIGSTVTFRIRSEALDGDQDRTETGDKVSAMSLSQCLEWARGRADPEGDVADAVTRLKRFERAATLV